MGGIKTYLAWALVVLVVLLGVFIFALPTKRYDPPEPVKMGQVQLQDAMQVAVNTDVPVEVAKEIVREVKATEGKPTTVIKDVPVAEVPKVIEKVKEADKPGKVIVTEPTQKDVNVYSIHLEKKTRLGVYGKMSIHPEVKPTEVGFMLKKNDDLLMLGQDFEKNRTVLTYGRFF